jgi:PST family polysaccharide transporter
MMGRVLGTAPVGIFSMANLFCDLPNRIISGPLQMVLYPRMAKLRDYPSSIKALYVFVSRILSILIVPSIGMIAVAHEPVFTIILSADWQQAGHIFMLLAPAGILQSITALRSTILMALSKTDLLLRQTIEMTVILLLPFLIFVWFGLEWATISISISTVICIPRFLSQVFPFIGLSFKEYITAIAPPIVVTFCAGMIYLIIEQFDIVQWEKFAAAILLGGFALVLSILWQFKEIKSEFYNLRNILSPFTA